MAGGTRMRESQFVDAQCLQERARLRELRTLWKIFCADFGKDFRERLAAEFELFATAFRIEFRQQFRDCRPHFIRNWLANAHKKLRIKKRRRFLQSITSAPAAAKRT